MASMTRAQMEKVIARGESVMVRRAGKPPRIVSRIEDLPSDADLAAESGDPAKQALAEADIDKEIARLQAQRAKLKPKAKADEPEPTPEPEPVKPQPHNPKGK